MIQRSVALTWAVDAPAACRMMLCRRAWAAASSAAALVALTAANAAAPRPTANAFPAADPTRDIFDDFVETESIPFAAFDASEMMRIARTAVLDTVCLLSHFLEQIQGGRDRPIAGGFPIGDGRPRET